MESVVENTLADHLWKFYAEVKTAKRQGVDAQFNDRHSCSKLTTPPYNRGMNIMKETDLVKPTKCS